MSELLKRIILTIKKVLKKEANLNFEKIYTDIKKESEKYLKKVKQQNEAR